jgi:hypothetical protein
MRRVVVSVAVLGLLGGCLGRDTVYHGWTLESLSSSNGFSLRTPTFDVPAGTEVQNCYFIRVPDLAQGADFWVGKLSVAVNPGSHHMNVFRVRTIVHLDPAAGTPFQEGTTSGTMISGGECFKSANWADWPLVINSQNSSAANPYTNWTLPAGVAHRFTPGELLMMQLHNVNASTQRSPYQAKAGINFYRTTDVSPVELGTLFATQQSIRICQSNPTVSYHGSCLFPPGTVTIAGANGHFHSRGTRFQIFSWDGRTAATPDPSAKFYESDAWDEPPMSFGLSVQPPSGGGVWWTCDYQWRQPSVGCDVVNSKDKQHANDCCYTFGPEVESNEHCNAFVYYYPKATSNVFCN